MLPTMPLFGRVYRKGPMWILVSLSKFRQPAVMLMQLSELLFGPVFEINQSIAGPSHRGNEFVQLQLCRLILLVLRPLNQKHHQEGDNRGAGIDDELPGVRKAEKWS